MVHMNRRNQLTEGTNVTVGVMPGLRGYQLDFSGENVLEKRHAFEHALDQARAALLGPVPSGAA